MTIHDLIKELVKWPSDGEVCVSRHISGTGSEPAYPLVGVSGFAGARIDGRDSGIALEIPPHAYRDELTDAEIDAFLAAFDATPELARLTRLRARFDAMRKARTP